MIEYKIMVIDTFDLMHKLYIHVKYTIDYCAISHKEKKKKKKKKSHWHMALVSGKVALFAYRARATISRRKLIKAT